MPLALQKRVLEELHEGHPGIVRMKSLARSHVWWPGLDSDIEQLAKGCMACQSVKNAPAVAPLHPWVWPDQPWDRIHIDFAGPFKGFMFMVIVDARSKWPEIIQMTSTTSAKVITELRRIFATYGLPRQLVSDNGPQFVSAEFSQFLKENGVKHIRCAPYHPASNGLAERFVQSCKKAVNAGERRGTPLQQSLAEFLLTYRVTPHATTNEAPCTLFFGRPLRTRLDLLHPDPRARVLSKQEQQKRHHDVHSRKRHFQVGQTVVVRNFREGPRWVPGVLVEQTGPLFFVVQLSNGALWKRHVDHIKSVSEEPPRDEREAMFYPSGSSPADEATRGLREENTTPGRS